MIANFRHVRSIIFGVIIIFSLFYRVRENKTRRKLLVLLLYVDFLPSLADSLDTYTMFCEA